MGASSRTISTIRVVARLRVRGRSTGWASPSGMLDLLDCHDVETRWVRGHAGNPGNERADELAVAASRENNLAVDEGYESQSRGPALRLSD